MITYITHLADQIIGQSIPIAVLFAILFALRLVYVFVARIVTLHKDAKAARVSYAAAVADPRWIR
jgi:hypothetical protein